LSHETGHFLKKFFQVWGDGIVIPFCKKIGFFGQKMAKKSQLGAKKPDDYKQLSKGIKVALLDQFEFV
jgi:hypothetical protein